MVYQNTFGMTKSTRATERNVFIITMVKLQQRFIWHVHYDFLAGGSYLDITISHDIGKTDYLVCHTCHQFL